MKAKEQILSLAKKKFKPVFLLGWLRFLSYDELKSVDLLEPYDQAFDAHQVKTNKDWDKLVVEYTEHNLLSGLCILMRKLFTTIATENWSLASIYANDIENWLYILDDIAEDFKISKGIVKIIYIVYLEANQADSQLTLRNLDFIPKNTIKQIITELQERLAKFYYND